MKKVNIILFVAIFTAICNNVFAQTQTITVVFKPDSAIGQDATIRMNNGCPAWATENYGNYGAFYAITGTWYSQGCSSGVARTLLKFDELSTIPANAAIVNAELKLYGTPSSSFAVGNSCYQGSSHPPNPSSIYKVLSAWGEQSVTWNTQPNIAPNPIITIPQTNSEWNWDFTTNFNPTNSANLLQVVQDWVQNPSQNFGFMIKLNEEAVYRKIAFASSDYPDPNLRPELIVTYEVDVNLHDTVLYDTVCYGENYDRWGFQKESVIADWRVTLYLTVAPVYHHLDTIALYANEFPFHYWNYTYNHSGTFTPLLRTRLGCDSLITLRINLLVTQNVDICETEYYDFYGTILNTSGIYRDTLRGVECDTLITLHLKVHPNTAETHFDDVICTGDRYRRHGFDIAPHDSAGIYHYQALRHTVWGCDSLVTLTLQVPDVRVKIISSNPDFCETYETTLTAVTLNNNIRWNTNETTRDITVTNSGTYVVIVNEHNCEKFDRFTIERCPFIFPNAITPVNADNINDYFYLPTAADMLEFSIFIYNRWGECVFSSTDPYFRWDGTFKGEIMQGSYTYVATYRTKNDKISKSVAGVITVY